MNVATLIATAPSLMLATMDDAGRPLASYAPFAPLPDGLGIVVSGLAAHTRHLLTRSAGCVLIVATQEAPDGSYARPRISIDVHARPEAPGSARADGIWSALERRHGQITQVLRGLPDFTAFTLEPLAARMVLGFAAAAYLDGPQIVAEIRAAATITR